MDDQTGLDRFQANCKWEMSGGDCRIDGTMALSVSAGYLQGTFARAAFPGGRSARMVAMPRFGASGDGTDLLFEVALPGRLGRGGFPGLSAGLAGRLRSGMTMCTSPAPNCNLWQGLYRIWFDVRATLQYYPAAAHRLLDRAQAVGRRHARLSPGEPRSCTPPPPLLVALDPAAAGGPGGLAGGGHLRPASGPRGIGGLDHRAEKHPLGRVLPGGHAGLPPFRPDAKDCRGTAGRWDCSCWAILSKTVTATLPGALLVIFWWQRGRLSWKNDVLPLVPLFLLGAAAGWSRPGGNCKLNKCVGPGVRTSRRWSGF